MIIIITMIIIIIITITIIIILTRQSTLRRQATTGRHEVTPATALSHLSLAGNKYILFRRYLCVCVFVYLCYYFFRYLCITVFWQVVSIFAYVFPPSIFTSILRFLTWENVFSFWKVHSCSRISPRISLRISPNIYCPSICTSSLLSISFDPNSSFHLHQLSVKYFVRVFLLYFIIFDQGYFWRSIITRKRFKCGWDNK